MGLTVKNGKRKEKREGSGFSQYMNLISGVSIPSPVPCKNKLVKLCGPDSKSSNNMFNGFSGKGFSDILVKHCGEHRIK